MIVGIDPGPRESAIVAFDGERVLSAEDVANDSVLDAIGFIQRQTPLGIDDVAIEWIESFGMAVGASTFETVFAIGQIATRLQWNNYNLRLVPRRDVKLNICKSPKAKDANIRQALIDRFGEVGTKKSPGPLIGISKHRWAALAIAVTAFDLPKTDNEAFFHLEPTDAS